MDNIFDYFHEVKFEYYIVKIASNILYGSVKNVLKCPVIEAKHSDALLKHIFFSKMRPI